MRNEKGGVRGVSEKREGELVVKLIKHPEEKKVLAKQTNDKASYKVKASI
jgi:hypothetical protein